MGKNFEFGKGLESKPLGDINSSNNNWFDILSIIKSLAILKSWKNLEKNIKITR